MIINLKGRGTIQKDISETKIGKKVYTYLSASLRIKSKKLIDLKGKKVNYTLKIETID